jgi:hypothetical protein
VHNNARGTFNAEGRKMGKSFFIAMDGVFYSQMAREFETLAVFVGATIAIMDWLYVFVGRWWWWM